MVVPPQVPEQHFTMSCGPFLTGSRISRSYSDCDCAVPSWSVALSENECSFFLRDALGVDSRVLHTPQNLLVNPVSQYCLLYLQTVRTSDFASELSQLSPVALSPPFSPSLMALTEISANVRKNGSQARRSAHESSQSKSPKMVKPDAVSNMLRTSTETGDIGQFSVCPWRLPRSASQHPTRSRSGSVSAAGAAFGTYARRPMPRHGAHFSPRPVPSLPALSRHDSVRSSLASFNSNTLTRCRAAPSIQYRPDRMASQAKVSGLYSQPSFLSLRGRPGSRRASPAFGDAQSMPMYSSRPGFHRAASVATATSSPASMFHGGLPYSYREVNKSASSFHSRLPSPAMPGAHPGVRRSPFPSRTATPASVSLHHTSTKHLTGSVESFPSMQGSTAGSTIPLYYDYTEAFADEDCKFPHQEIPVSSPSSANHTIPEQEAARPTGQVHSQSGIVWRSASKQSERLTQHNPGHSERLKGGSREEKVVQNSEQNESKEIEKHSTGKPEVGLNFSSSQPFKLGLTDK